MWYLTLAQLFSSIVKEYDFVETYRLSFGFMSLNPIDAIVYSLLIFALLFGNRADASPKNRVHPMLFVTISLLLIGGLCGWIGAITFGTPAEFSLRQARDHFAWPVCIFAGYRLLPNSKSAWRYMYILGVAGIFTSTMTILNFANGTQSFAEKDAFNDLRTVQFVTCYAGLAASMFAFSMIYKPTRMMPTFLAVLLTGFCLIGQFAPLGRSEWLEAILCVVAMFVIAPTGNRMAVILKGLGLFLFFGVVMYGSVQLVSAVTHRDFGKTMNERVMSMIPGSDTRVKAWDSRTGSISQELDIWKQHPIFGEGFAAQLGELERGKIYNSWAYFHNGWSSVLATEGIFGFAGYMCIIGSLLVVGWRLVRSQWDRGTTMLGAFAFSAGVYLCILAVSSICWYSRLALFLGVVCGMALRLRDIQLTQLATADGDELHHASEELPQFHEALAPVNEAFI